MQVIKRNGAKVDFDGHKIFNALNKCRDAVAPEINTKVIQQLTRDVVSAIEVLGSQDISIETIQDLVETALMMNGYYSMTKAYIEYRYLHKISRDANENLMATCKEIFFADSADVDAKRSNANINTDAPMGIMLNIGAESSKHFVNNYVLPKEFADAHKEHFIHIHDQDFSLITLNCCQIDLLKLLHGGFSTGHGFLREPNSIRSYAALACIAIQANQNDMFGGQSINAFDFAMAEGVKKSFRKALYLEIERACSYTNARIIDADVVDQCRFSLKFDDVRSIDLLAEVLEDRELAKKIYVNACQSVAEETHQAMEALIHNFNTLHSRAGAQVPFSSINYGMDTSPEGRLVIREVLTAIKNGLGKGETAIFPISVFQLKSGVNYNEGDPNYDLFKYACEVSAKRLFPNFLNLDAPYNAQYYKAGDYNSFVATMGCRSRVMGNVNGAEVSGGRGNFAFVTINLPKLALEAGGDTDKFFALYDKYIQLCHDYLLFRLKYIAAKKVYNFPFLMGQGVWLDSDKLNPDDEIGEVLKHASYSIGFCGLAECLIALTGKHHGESQQAQSLGLDIVGHLRAKTDAFTAADHMNWTTFATPAESTAGTFQRANRAKFGVIEGVTDREYMTNSNHVPVYYKISAFDKIKIEAPYHALCNAGHIAYIEMDGDPSKNIHAFEKIIRAMHDADMGYFSVNHPVDYDPVCGYTGIINNVCPKCGRKETPRQRFIKVRRITGYLSPTYRWNDPKRAELRDRTKHAG